MQNWIQYAKNLKSFLLKVSHRFFQDRCVSTASSLSFTTLLALVPLVTVVFSMLSLLPVSETVTKSIESFLFENFVPAAGETVQGYLLDFSAQAGKLTAVGLIFLMFSSLSLLATIEDSFNAIWKVEKNRHWFQRLIIYWALLTLGPLLIVISLSMSSALLSMSIFAEQAIIASFTETLLRYLPVLLEICAYMLFYQSIPNLEVKLLDSFVGAVVATVLFEISKFGFAIWILNFNSYELIYGALATIPVFIIWIYLCWLVLLIGALVAATLRENRTEKLNQSLV